MIIASMAKNIEVEIRSFISQEQYTQLLSFFHQQGKFLSEDEQVTYYFNCEQDLRIQKNKFYAKVWMKKGKLHDDSREEIEIKLPVAEFETLENLFLSLGYAISIKWFRQRHSFRWQDIDVAVDYTKGYGYILELEQMATDEGKGNVLDYLKGKLVELGIVETPKEEFDQKYKYYKENWKELVNNG